MPGFLDIFRRAEVPVVAPKVVEPPPRREPRISDFVMGASRAKKQPINPFDPAKPMPGVGRSDEGKFASDSAIGQSLEWASNSFVPGLYDEGLTFVGYPYLAALAQRPEYRQISETIARNMTRKWIKLKGKGDEDKSEKIAQLEDAMKHFRLKESFCKIAEEDGFFGRSHLHIDLGEDLTDAELRTPIGNGWDELSKSKVKVGSIKGFRPIEAVWCYPSKYNSTNPRSPDWYNPSTWFVMDKEIHATRILRFVGREVPDLLKAAYSFGGLSLSQMAKPYVDNWIKTRRSVADLISAFSIFVLSTNVTESMAAQGDQIFRRAELFNNIRDNSGLLMVDKTDEDFKNVSAPLGTLDQLQAQAQEHMAAVSGIPMVELAGIQPAGLNASSDGEIETFHGKIHSQQENLFGPNLHAVIGFVMIHLWGEPDPDITWDFEPLSTMDQKETSEIRKNQADVDVVYVDAGILDILEVRKRLAGEEDSPYAGLDADDVPMPRVSENDADAGLPEPPRPDLNSDAGV